ncbi:MAG: SPW repeat protein [Thiohalomonadales bacterium]
MKEQRWQDWTVVTLGAWLILAPFVGIGLISDVAAVNSYIIGSAVAIFGIAALSNPQIWQEYTNLVLGLWLIAAPFTLGFTNLAVPMWNQVIVGLLIVTATLAVTMQKPMEGHGHGHGHA